MSLCCADRQRPSVKILTQNRLDRLSLHLSKCQKQLIRRARCYHGCHGDENQTAQGRGGNWSACVSTWCQNRDKPWMESCCCCGVLTEGVSTPRCSAAPLWPQTPGGEQSRFLMHRVAREQKLNNKSVPAGACLCVRVWVYVSQTMFLLILGKDYWCLSGEALLSHLINKHCGHDTHFSVCACPCVRVRVCVCVCAWVCVRGGILERLL